MQNRNQQGYLLISAIILIVIVGFLAVTVAYLVLTEALSSSMQLDSTRAFYIARSGIEINARRLLGNDFSERMACESMSEDNELLFEGVFRVTDDTDRHHYVSDPTALKTSIGASNAVIPINDVAGYIQPRGRVLIDREAIDYRGISEENADCNNNPPCLFDVTRGVGGTVASSHSSGTPIAQNQCLVTVEGAVPDFDDPIAKRKVVGEVKQLEEGWMVGLVSSGKETIVRWNGESWDRYSDTGHPVPNVNLNAIDRLSYVDAWAVGDGGTILHWNGDYWSDESDSITSEVLRGISCADHSHCHAVGDNAIFLYWNGSVWTSKTAPTPAGIRINAVSCSSASHCLAVGHAYDNAGTFEFVLAKWDGSSWTTASYSDAASGEDLLGISCPSDNYCQAVGINSTFLQWSGTSWSDASKAVSFPTGRQMNAVYCVGNNDCWAVGNDETFAHWNGTNWSQEATTLIGNYSAITCSDSNDCWTVGDGGIVAHWNGSNWSSVSLDPTIASDFRGISLIADHTQHHVPWHEAFD